MSFELFRNNSRDVEILTFDELSSKVERIQQLVKGETGDGTAPKTRRKGPVKDASRPQSRRLKKS
jgi:hypothetical protein